MAVITQDPPPAVPQTRLAALARLQLRHRRRRHPAIGQELFADPAWDILLDLFVAGVEGRPPALTEMVMVAEVPQSTTFRWISALIDRGLVYRTQDPGDGRRRFVTLTADAHTGMTRLLTRWYLETAALFNV